MAKSILKMSPGPARKSLVYIVNILINSQLDIQNLIQVWQKKICYLSRPTTLGMGQKAEIKEQKADLGIFFRCINNNHI